MTTIVSISDEYITLGQFLKHIDVIPTFLRFVTGSLTRVPNSMLATSNKGCARCGT